ncbi:hypothetical protein N0B44_21090 [Roseibacterium beibuensis]|uniref:hypothetical protein n=1 Tax=[Roseibacterium] beibuensis TaxID=1193142 RepID=UPI00217DA9C4|nr:hypothetical protein [Roseibacterium beibuensis]MCS6625411.1 hypothetical protein [Roseibacterium beibuensis]
MVTADGLSAAQVPAITLSTAAVLFPERRIGCFEPGCEADVLVLQEDPMADIRVLRRIDRRVMAGQEIPASAEPA